jgi:CxxC-x17-CxxC domain-containing protein
VVGQSKSTIDIFELMNTGKIFLVNVSKGRIGEDNSALLGAMIITKIQLSAMERVRIPEEERVDFYLYVDEFQNFATDSFAGILSEARKYRLNLILAHQYIGQLVTDVSTKVRDAVFGNVGTMICFRVGAADAEFLEKEFEPEITPQDLVNLPNYSIYLRLMVDGVTCRPFSAATLPPFKFPDSTASEEKIIQNSQKRYARPRYAVEEEINKWSGVMETAEGGITIIEPGKFPAVCAICGKTFGLPFEPTGSRPVYCRDCLAKVKAGEIAPASKTKPENRPPKAERFAALAELGIEFENQPGVGAAGPDRPAGEKSGRPAVSPAAAAPRQGEIQTQKPKPKPAPPVQPESRGLPLPARAERVTEDKEEKLSLSSLAARETPKKPQRERTEKVDIEALRKSISESLKDAL